MKKLILLLFPLLLVSATLSAQLGLITSEQRKTIESNRISSMQVASVLITYEDDSVAKDIIELPDGAVVWDIDVRQVTNFNDGGVDSLEIGTMDDPDYFVDMVVNTGATAWTSMSYENTPPYLLPADNTIRAMYWGGDSDATTGQVAVYVQYTLFK